MIKSFLFAFALLLFMPLFAQDEKSSALFYKEDTKKKDPLLEVGLRQSGPYFGIQQGKYTLAEIGGEMQWRKIRLKKPTTHAIHAGLDYNLFENVLGFSTGYYYKGGRTKFTYGGSLVYRTDFTHHRFGISPALGYKLFGFHGQVGYALLMPHDNFVAVNNLFVSLRFVLINERDVELNSRLKKKK
ncbi:MAG: hypothetical protein P8O07_09830 [Crocinitomicaceae bacterium]|nr:hypothetical protein [Crocinitomicaceae bacterium]